MKRFLLLFLNIFVLYNLSAQSNGCTTATTIAMNATCVPTAGTTTGATQTIAGCAGTADDDVWYQFTATATSVQIIVAAGDASFDPVVQLFSGGCGVLASLSCTDNGGFGVTETLNSNSLVIGQVYRIRVYHYFAGSGSGNFTICVKDAPIPPSNDDCAGSTVLPVNAICSYTSATTNGASESQLGCAGNADDDVWFSFVATNSVQNVLVDPIDNLDLVFQVFEGSCGALNTILCEDNTFSGTNEQSDIVGLTPGQTYFVRVYDYYTGVTGDFDICITGPPTPAPVNDEPCNAIALPIVTSECNYGFYTTTGATASMGAPTPSACVGGSGAMIGGFSATSQDVWFSIVVPASGNLDIIPEPNGGAGTISDGAMALYTGNCGALTQVACADDYDFPGASNDLLPLITATGLTPGSTVYVRYWGFGTTSGDFGLCVTTTENDDCANALYICDPNGYSSSTSPAYTADRPSNMHGNNEDAAGVNLVNGIDSGGPFGDGNAWDGSYPFAGSPALDVNIENNSWIKFTASATTVTLNVDIYDCWVGNYPSGGIQMQVFEATNCVNFVPVSNFAENSSGFILTATALTVGQDYYLMIDGYAGDICNYTITADSGVQFPDITPNTPIICQDESVTLTAPSGATSYLWSHSGEVTPSVSVTPGSTQTYTCEVTGLCSYKQSLTALVTVNPNPTFTSLSSNTPICSGEDVIFTLTGSPNATITYTINGGVDQTVVTNGSGSATVTISGATANQTILLSDIEFTSTGCNVSLTNTTTVTVNSNPTYTVAGSDPTSCTGTEGTITISGLTASTAYTITYDDDGTTVGPASFTSNASGAIVITGLNAGAYDDLVVELTSTNCSTSDAGLVTLSDPGSPNITNVVGSNPTSCSGTQGSITISGLAASTAYDVTYDDDGSTVGPTSITTNAAGEIIITGLNSGTYDNISVALAGCSTSSTATINLTDPASPSLTTLSSNTPICSGQNAVFTLTGSANATITYTINGGADQTVVTNGSGSATVTISGATANQTILLSDIEFTSTGCNVSLTNTTTVTVNPNPIFTSLTSNTSICRGEDAIFTLTGSPNATITYTINGGADQTVVTNGSGSATVTISGATANQTILLSDIEFTSTGCSTTLTNTTTVTVNATPTYTVAGTDPTLCATSDGILTISGLDNSTVYNVSYDDVGTTVGPAAMTSNGTGQISITGLSQGNYDNFVISYVSTSCSTISATLISLNDPGSPVISSIVNTNTTTCSGSDGTITISGLTANIAYNLTYDDDGTTVGPISITTNGSGQIVLTGLDAGTYDNYIVEITGCSVSNNTSSVISDPVSPNITGIVGIDPTTCSGTDGSITISGLVAGTVYSVAYDLGGVTQGPANMTANSSGNIVIGSLGQGAYDNFEVTITATSCTDTDNTLITLSDPGTPNISSIVNSNTTTCGGADGTITIAGLTASTSYNISYDDDAVTVGPTAMTTNVNGEIIITGLDAGSYTNFVVELTGCTTNDNTIITLSDPTPPSIDAGNPTLSLCEGELVTLTSINPDGATITWDNSVVDGVAFIQPIGTVTYTVTATATNNCTNTDNIIVSLNSNPTVDLSSMTVVDAACSNTGGSITGITAIGSPILTYNWTDGTNSVGTSIDVSGLSAGTYYLTVIDGNNCMVDTLVPISFVNDANVLAVDDSAATQSNTPVSVDVYINDLGNEASITIVDQPQNGSVTYQGNGLFNYIPNNDFFGTDSFTYLICDLGCSDICDTALVKIEIEKLGDIIIPNGFSPNGDNINDNFVILNLEQYENNSIVIFNRWGDKVFEASPYLNDWDGSSSTAKMVINGDEVVDGTYFFIIDFGVEDKEPTNGFIDLRRK